MEDENKNNKNEEDNWVVCTSIKRANAKYLFNTRTGESKWLTKTSQKEVARTSEVVTNISKSKTPAQDRLQHLQKELKKDLKNKTNSSVEIIKKTINLKAAKNVKLRNDAVQRSQSKRKLTATSSSNVGKPKEKNIKLQKKEETNVKLSDRLKRNVPTTTTSNISKATIEVDAHLNLKEKVIHTNTSADSKIVLFDDKIKNNTVVHSKIQKRISIITETALPQKEVHIKTAEKPAINSTRKIDKVLDVGIKKSKTSTEIKPFSTFKKISANERLNTLRKILHEQKSDAVKEDNVAKETLLEPSTAADFEIEPMDWETVDDAKEQNIVNTFQGSVEITKTENAENTTTNNNYCKSRINENLMHFSNERRLKNKEKWRKNYFYIIPDTNVWLNNLTFLDELCRMKLLDTQGSILYIPYVVIKELDGLKNREIVDIRAKRAINYIHEKLNSNSQHVQAQSANDEREHLISVDIADDAIINCCLQVQQHVPHSLLLSDDTNLRNKAKCNDLLVSTKSDLLSIHIVATNDKK